jgi:hypothetical protein
VNPDIYNWEATVHESAIGRALESERMSPDFGTPARFVSLRDWVLVPDLPATGFVAHRGKHPVGILSVNTDRGPRRIVFVAENGSEMPEAARQIEAALITDILSKARPEDSFALLSARGPRVETRFVESREAVRAAAETLVNPPRATPNEMGVQDAIVEATRWLQPPQLGDSIFVWALGLEGRHQLGFSEVRKAVSAGRIRVFGFQLGAYNAEDPAIDQLEAFGTRYSDEAFTLSTGTGGATIWADTEPAVQYLKSGLTRRKFRLTDDYLNQLKGDAERMYEAATEFYVLQLSSTGPDVQIGLAPGAEKYLPEKLPVAMVLYPRNLPPCSNASGALPTKVKNP